MPPDVGAPLPRTIKVSSIPQMQAHWHAAGEIPAEHAAKIGTGLARVLLVRQQQLASVCSEYEVGASAQDKRNLMCGLRGISYVEKGANEAAAWRVGERSFTMLAEAIAHWHATEAWRPVYDGSLTASPDDTARDSGDSHEVVVFSDSSAQYEVLAEKLLAKPKPSGSSEASLASASAAEATSEDSLAAALLAIAASGSASASMLPSDPPFEEATPDPMPCDDRGQEATASSSDPLGPMQGHWLLNQRIAMWFPSAGVVGGVIEGWDHAEGEDPAQFLAMYDDGDVEHLSEQAAAAGVFAARAQPATTSEMAKKARRLANAKQSAESAAKQAARQVAKDAKARAAEEVRAARVEAKARASQASKEGLAARAAATAQKAKERAEARAKKTAAAEAKAKEDPERTALRSVQRPSATELASYLRFRGDGTAELDALHFCLSDAVLDVYVEWHLEGGRLAHQRPPDLTRESLRAMKNGGFRVPFSMLVSVSTFANRNVRLMAKATLSVCIPIPGQVRDDSKCPAYSYVRKMMTALREEPTLDYISSDETVSAAYIQSLRELGQISDRKAQPLINSTRDAILEQCGDLTTPRQVRLATWTVNAPVLMQRSCEGLSSLHADMQIKARAQHGGWRVPGFTKTTDGLEGFVDTWEHRDQCKFARCTLHEALERPEDELREAAGATGADGHVCLRSACAVCLTWLSRKMQGHGAAESDGVHPLYQEINAAGDGFTGRVVDPVYLVQDLREAMEAADKSLEARGLSKLPAEGRVLYMARHGGIMQYLKDAQTIEWVAERARIPVETLVRHYRSHNIIDDAFESNGYFGQAQMITVRAMAQSNGFLASEADIQQLLKLCDLTLEEATATPRAELYAILAPKVVADVSTVSASAALLRNCHIRDGTAAAIAEHDGVREMNEDDELSAADLMAAFEEASHRQALEQSLLTESALASSGEMGPGGLALTGSPSGAASAAITDQSEAVLALVPPAAASVVTSNGGTRTRSVHPLQSPHVRSPLRWLRTHLRSAFRLPCITHPFLSLVAPVRD